MRNSIKHSLLSRALFRQLNEHLTGNQNSKRTKVWDLIKDIIGIVSAIGTIYFAIVSINLTKKYGESKEQIERLTTIAENQMLQLDKLVNMVEQQKTQSDLMNKQAEVASSLFNLNRHQYQENKRTDSLLELIDMDRVMDVFYAILDKQNYATDSTNELKNSNNATILYDAVPRKGQ